MERDTQIFDLIDKECHRQKEGLELIASENFVSEQVMQAMGSCLTNKYAEGYPGARYYGGCQIVDQTEQLAIDRACKLFGAEFANVQPHSGAQANAAVFFACMKPGDTFLGLDLAHGGHLSHGSPVNLSGINYHPVAYHVKEETGMVDYDEMEKLAIERADMIYNELERSKMFRPVVKEGSRSRMNIPFLLREGYESLEKEFLDFTKSKNIVGIKGHRSVGGFRASTYNACTIEDVKALVAAMQEFEAAHIK